MLLFASDLDAQVPPQVIASTHDATVPRLSNGSVVQLPEAWADVKTPGDGRTYAVGTIEVERTANAFFSGRPTAIADTLTDITGNVPKQVVMVQVTDPLDPSNTTRNWQRYLYGRYDSPRTTNARGVAVWAGPTPEDTRVVVCGETFEFQFPLATVAPFVNGFNSAGFIAVFNGNGDLLWTHVISGGFINPNSTLATFSGDVAVTDVCIHVTQDAAGNLVDDEITYCGISTHGNPANNHSMTPVLPFAAPASGEGASSQVQPAIPCVFAAGGNADNGPLQWDGFVGRVVHSHPGALTSSTTIAFHSIVGGNQQDGLFGIDELSVNRFTVVGSTAGGKPPIAAPTPLGTNTFPLTLGDCLPSSGDPPYCLGVWMVFDAAPTRSGLPLVLERSIAFGHRGAANTMAHDVHAQPAASDSALLESCFIVGATTDAGMFENVTSFPDGVAVLLPPPPGSGAPHGGGVDGFVFSIGPSSTNYLLVPWYTFRGGPGDEGINGVAAWNEFRGQVAVVGWKHVVGPNYDIDVGSYYTSESYGGSPSWAMRPLTGAQVGGEGWEAPAVNGQSEVTRGVDASTPFWDLGLGGPSTYPLGNPASPRGGGISQDQTGRVRVVGATRSPQGAGTYPVVGVGGISKQADLQDAVQTALDLLPATMARTDGTGPLPLGTIAGDGGTTPPCALLPFGNRVGSPSPPLQRMLINYDGTVPQLGAGGLGNFVVTRPPSDLLGVAAFLRLGFPGYVLPGFPGGPTNPFQPIVLPDGVEFWTPDELYVVTYGPVSNAVWTSPPVAFPTNSITVTVQAFFLVTNGIPSGNPAVGLPCASGTTTLCATPAIVVSY